MLHLSLFLKKLKKAFERLAGSCWYINNKDDACRDAHSKCLALLRHLLGDKHPDTCRSIFNVAIFYWQKRSTNVTCCEGV